MSGVFALPTVIILARGHLGRDRWQVPTPGAFAFFFWLLGIVPALIEWTEESVAWTSFSADAVVWSRLVTFAWFILFAVSLGPAPTNPRFVEGDRLSSGLTLGVVLVVWGLSAAFAEESGLLSFYSPHPVALAEGSVSSAVVGWYLALTPLVMPLATIALTGMSRTLRWVGSVGLLAGALGLFLLSERRLVVVCIYLCLFVVQFRYATLKRRWIMLALVAGWLMIGPLVMVYRGARAEEGPAGDAVSQAWQSAATYATDERVRSTALRDVSDNVRTRLGASVVLFAIIDQALEYGPNLSPSPLGSIVRMVPSFVWPSKNDVANSLSAELQFAARPGIPDLDFGLSPIAEFVFQCGPWLAALGGILYGLAGRALNASSSWGARGGPSSIAWLGCIIALSYFDAGTTPIISLREPLVLALALSALLALRSRGASSPRPPNPWSVIGEAQSQEPRATRANISSSGTAVDIP